MWVHRELPFILNKSMVKDRAQLRYNNNYLINNNNKEGCDAEKQGVNETYSWSRGVSPA